MECSEGGDNEAVASSLAGRPEAFAVLVRRHGQAMHAYLARRTDRQIADNLLAEMWLRAFRSRSGYDQRRPDARPWLYGIARHVLHAHYRHRTREPGGLVEPASDPWADADARLDAARCRDRLRAGLNALRQADREVLLLAAWEQLSPTEIATVLGIPPGTARWRLHRARKQLDRHLQNNHTLGGADPAWEEA